MFAISVSIVSVSLACIKVNTPQIITVVYCFQEYNFESVKDRQHLISLHKNAKKSKMDIERYNILKDEIAKIEYDIRRLRDPLQLRVPIREIDNKQPQ